MMDLESYRKLINSVKVLRTNPDFMVFTRYLNELLDGERTQLETTKPDVIQLGQGKVAMLREVLGLIENVHEAETGLEEVLKQGESE